MNNENAIDSARDRRIAYHEAAHLTVGRALGAQFGGATIEANAALGFSGLCWGPDFKSHFTGETSTGTAVIEQIVELMPRGGDERGDTAEIYQHVFARVTELAAASEAEIFQYGDAWRATDDRRQERSLAALIYSSAEAQDIFISACAAEAPARSCVGITMSSMRWPPHWSNIARSTPRRSTKRSTAPSPSASSRRSMSAAALGAISSPAPRTSMNCVVRDKNPIEAICGHYAAMLTDAPGAARLARLARTAKRLPDALLARLTELVEQIDDAQFIGNDIAVHLFEVSHCDAKYADATHLANACSAILTTRSLQMTRAVTFASGPRGGKWR